MSLSFVFGVGGEERGVKHVGGQLIEREAMRGASLMGLFVQILYGGIEQSEDRDGRIFGANLLNDTQALVAPGMKIDGQGIPASGGEQTKELTRGLGTMYAQRSAGGFRKRMRNS